MKSYLVWLTMDTLCYTLHVHKYLIRIQIQSTTFHLLPKKLSFQNDLYYSRIITTTYIQDIQIDKLLVWQSKAHDIMWTQVTISESPEYRGNLVTYKGTMIGFN